MSWEFLIRTAWALIVLATLVLGGLAAIEYQGSVWIYLLFTCLSFIVLYLGFGRRAIFFDAFIGVLVWIGFWLKFSVRTAFSDGQFQVAVGDFDGSPAALDQALLVVCCAMAAIILARLVRSRWLFNYPGSVPPLAFSGLFSLYSRYRRTSLLLFVALILLVCVSNIFLGIYQRGHVPQVHLPLGLNGVYTWLLLFGMASISALILRFEFEINRNRYWVGVSLALVEVALSNFSMWSRGMVLNGSSMLYGMASLFRRDESRVRLALLAFSLVLFAGLLVVTVLGVNILRAHEFHGSGSVEELQADMADRGGEAIYGVRVERDEIERRVTSHTVVLFIDRWVGIEGVMSVVGAESRGWDIFREALSEKADTSVNSFYDRVFIDSFYDNAADSRFHFISLPGYIAFLYYPGSYIFLFFSVFAFSALASLIELFVYHYGGRNLIFCALISQVVAFRYTSFGYVPMQSYLLFGSIFLNVILFYFADQVVRLIFVREPPVRSL